MLSKVIKIKVKFLGLTVLFISICASTALAQEARKTTRTTPNVLFRATPTEQIRYQEQSLIEQALQDKFESEYNYQDQYDPEYRWAARMKERGLLDDEDVRSIAKNRAANRTRRTFEEAIKGSQTERAYKKLVRGLRDLRDFSTVKIDENEKGKITAKHDIVKDKEKKPIAVMYVQPDLTNGLTAVVDTKKNFRIQYQPTRNRLIFGYQINF